MVEIISRTVWGAQHAAGFGPAPLPAREIWLHHSATTAPPATASLPLDASAVRLLEQIGQARFGGGISYSFVIPPSGRIFEGHGIDRQGAHTKGRNSFSRAICLIGNYDVAVPTAAQLDAVAALLHHGADAEWWNTAALTGGHRDAPGAATACPGQHAYALIGEMNRRAQIAPTRKDWFDMATEADLARLLDQRLAPIARRVDVGFARDQILAALGMKPQGFAAPPSVVEAKLDQLLALVRAAGVDPAAVQDAIVTALGGGFVITGQATPASTTNRKD